VFSEHGKSNFYEYKEALDYAVTLGETTVHSYMKDAGLDPNHITIDVQKEEIIPVGWKTPMETKIVVLGVGNRKIEQDCC
jgi:N-methylhydantoinase A/oxoprolinase/acetone carboxylase beta subunit